MSRTGMVVDYSDSDDAPLAPVEDAEERVGHSAIMTAAECRAALANAFLLNVAPGSPLDLYGANCMRDPPYASSSAAAESKILALLYYLAAAPEPSGRVVFRRVRAAPAPGAAPAAAEDVAGSISSLRSAMVCVPCASGVAFF